MELYLDTANVAEVERLARIFPIAGVTTNPSIIAASRESIWDVLPRLQQAIGPEGTLFAQTMSRDAEGMVAEAKRLSNAIPGIVVKIPVTAQGLIAIKALKKEDNHAGHRRLQRGAGLARRTRRGEICRAVRQPRRRAGR